MTYRLCVIGNSHVAAFKLGWDQLVAGRHALADAITPTFFGAPRDGLKNLAASDGRLVPTSDAVKTHFLRMSDGRADIDPAVYDGFLLVGLGASLKRTLRLYRSHRWFGVSQTAGAVVTSRGFVRAFLSEGYGGTRLALIARMLASICDKPVFATAEPHWAPLGGQGANKQGDFGWAVAAEAGDGKQLADLFHSALSKGVGDCAAIILQPPATIEKGIVTRARYNKGASKMITGDGDESDAAHMNADYGAIWWTESAAAFGVTSASAEKTGRRAGKRAS